MLCFTWKEVHHRINYKPSNCCGCKNGKCDPKTYLARYDGTDRQEEHRQGRQGNIHAILDSAIIFFSSGFYLSEYMWVHEYNSGLLCSGEWVHRNYLALAYQGKRVLSKRSQLAFASFRQTRRGQEAIWFLWDPEEEKPFSSVTVLAQEK